MKDITALGFIIAGLVKGFYADMGRTLATFIEKFFAGLTGDDLELALMHSKMAAAHVLVVWGVVKAPIMQAWTSAQGDDQKAQENLERALDDLKGLLGDDAQELFEEFAEDVLDVSKTLRGTQQAT